MGITNQHAIGFRNDAAPASIRRANRPRWFIVTGLIHDLGTILCLWGEPQYDHLMSDRDCEMFRWVRAFNRYDLYSKSRGIPDRAALRPYYEDLVAEYVRRRSDSELQPSQYCQ